MDWEAINNDQAIIYYSVRSASVMINWNWNGLKKNLSYSFFTYWTNWNFAFDSKIFTRITRIAIARKCWRADWIIAKNHWFSMVLEPNQWHGPAWAGLAGLDLLGDFLELGRVRIGPDWNGTRRSPGNPFNPFRAIRGIQCIKVIGQWSARLH